MSRQQRQHSRRSLVEDEATQTGAYAERLSAGCFGKYIIYKNATEEYESIEKHSEEIRKAPLRVPFLFGTFFFLHKKKKIHYEEPR